MSRKDRIPEENARREKIRYHVRIVTPTRVPHTKGSTGLDSQTDHPYTVIVLFRVLQYCDSYCQRGGGNECS